MTGTLVNVAGIVLGSLIGLMLKRGIPQRVNDSIVKVEGVAILVIGLNGVLIAMLRADPQTGKISDSGALLLLVSLVGGCVIGELLRIDDRLNNFGQKVEERSGASGFAKGFVTASLVFAIGAMGIVGAIQDGLTGDGSVLYIKSLLDFTTSIVLGAALGVGVAFSAIPVLIMQGAFSLLASVISPYISDDLLSVFCMVGYAIVMCIGFNFLCDSKVKIANMLPALIFPVAYYFLFAV